MQRRAGLLCCLGSLVAMGLNAGCGNSSSDQIPVDQAVLDNVAPVVQGLSYVGFCTEDTCSDATVGQGVQPLEQALEDDTASVQQALTACHPHLFQRTQEVIRLFNRHFYKALRHTSAIISSRATRSAQNGTSFTWIKERPFGGGDSARADAGASNTVQLTIKITLTKNSATSYDYSMMWKAASSPDSAYVQVLGGHFDAVANARGQGTGTMDISYNAMRLDPSEKAGGSVHVVFKNVGDNHYVRAELTNVVFDNDPNRVPRTATFVHGRIKGVGGSNKFQDALNLYCPANPQQLVANLSTVNRWYIKNGVHVGRSDSLATGGQIPAGNRWLGLTCHSSATTPPEGFWQIQQLSAQGSVTFKDSEGLIASCDARFGECAQTSCPPFDFTTVSMTDASVIPFPGLNGINLAP